MVDSITPADIEDFSRDGCMSFEARRRLIRDFGKNYKLNTLVETGTNDGGTPWYLKDDFAQIYTIELGQDLWRSACEVFNPFPHVRCLQGDSADVLRTVLEELREPALFWLDAHYDGVGSARGSIDTPIRTELALILSHNCRHVVLIDDARLFMEGAEHTEDFKDYPSLSWVRDLATEHGYQYELHLDVIRLRPTGS
jgi:hypothetical protein